MSAAIRTKDGVEGENDGGDDGVGVVVEAFDAKVDEMFCRQRRSFTEADKKVFSLKHGITNNTHNTLYSQLLIMKYVSNVLS